MPPPLWELMQRFDLMPDAMEAARADQRRALREHGIGVVCGTDSGISPPKTHGDSAWRAIREAAATAPIEEALASGTSYAAAVLGLGSVTGRLGAGYAADVLVVDGDVRADVEALGRPVAVLVRGVEVATPR